MNKGGSEEMKEQLSTYGTVRIFEDTKVLRKKTNSTKQRWSPLNYHLLFAKLKEEGS